MDHWKSTGAFMLRFIKDGNYEFVIVDDYIPVTAQGQPAFSSGGTTGKEAWVCILEKAYAKLYGDYSFIEAGKIPLCLANMVPESFPQQLNVADLSSNTDLFWTTISDLKKLGSLLGAGSPPHEDGDTAFSPDGIVFGHAYAILQIRKYDGEVLV
jgi:hypothetical protein